ncbi:hypothetical protein [Desulfovibrio sp. SGI.169]|uniref:hypothetical protein n=1 Tax=Desulfovibrio sp. SGI.169 TaxID=3420561 RepID=UPI003D0215E9
MNWLKWFIGSAVDPKFAVVARRTGQNVAAVLAVWAMLLERAGQSDEHGSVAGFDCEGADVVLGLDDGAACSIIDAMRSKGLIDEQQRIANWDKRQAREESEAARERKRLQREREKLEAERVALEKARVEHAAMSQDVTDCHAMSQDVTNVTPKRRIEEIRNINTSPPVESLVNQDRARAREVAKGGKASPLPPGMGNGEPSSGQGREERGDQRAPDPANFSGPGMEFVELRDFYSREIRAEGPLDGFAEYKQLKAARDPTGASVFPGLFQILDDLAARKAAKVWNPGYEISLARYLKTRTWLAPIQARASPQAKSWQEREDEANYAAAIKEAARYEAEKARRREVHQ